MTDRILPAERDFQAIHAEFRPRVLRYLTRLVGERDAEDLAQAVMLKVNEGLHRFRGDSTVSTWIYRIATNTAMDKLRQQKGQHVSEADLEAAERDLPAEAQIASTEETAARQEMSACIAEFVTRLPDNYRTVMVLSELEGFKNEEIASLLGFTLDTVKIRLHRARARLRKELEAGCDLSRDEGNELACDRKPTKPLTFHPRR